MDNDPIAVTGPALHNHQECPHGNYHGPCSSCLDEAIYNAVTTAERRAVAEAERRFERWKDEATEQAHQYADNNNLCGEFDKFMVSIGLRPRLRTYSVTVAVNMSVLVNVEAQSADDAQNQVTDEEVANAVRSAARDGDIDWDATDANPVG
jgi:hypothetical protein